MIKEKGQTLLEAMIGLGVAISVVSAIVVAIVSSLGNTQFSKNQNLANQYAQQGMEIVRKIRDASWSGFLAYNATYYCLAQNNTSLMQRGVNGCGQNVGIFVREIDIEHNSGSCQGIFSKVTSVVSWSDSKCTSTQNTYCHNVTLISCFANNNAVPSP